MVATKATGTIVSRLKFAKDGRHFQAGLDPSKGVVVVLEDGSAKPHNLTEHFTSTALAATHEIVSRVKEAHAGQDRSAEVKASGLRIFTFMPTSHCNMGCSYCGQEHIPGNVLPAITKRFLCRIEAAFRTSSVNHVHVAWFGGEPMLAYRSIVALSESILQFSQETGTHYSSKMTTNGSLLNPLRLRELIDKCAVTRFDITIDGPPHVHDEHRPLINGGSTYGKIISALESFRDTDYSREAVVVIRTNVDVRNMGTVSEHLHRMKSLGFDDPGKFLFELAPIHSWSNDVSDLAIPTSEAADLEIQWMELMERLGLPYGLLPSRKLDGLCIATDRNAELIDSLGNVFSCSETPLTSQSGTDKLARIHRLAPGDLRPAGPFDGWEEAVDTGGIPCSSCDLRPICGGACPKLWMEGNVPCPTLKLNFDRRLGIFMHRHGYETISVQ